MTGTGALKQGGPVAGVMPLIEASSLTKGFADVLFADASFYVDEGDRVALVGPNGAGKSTLLRILAGHEKPDDGAVRLAAGLKVHWFDQHPEVPKGAKGSDLLGARRPAPPALAQEHEALEARIADPALYEQPGYEEVLERYAAVEREIAVATEPVVDAGVTALLAEFGLTPSDLERPATSLSGGERTRLFLARTLAAAGPGDLLVLDEPTNHLDVDAIEWLEDWLCVFEGTVLMVAHDRVFLDNVATRVFEVAERKITCYQGDYEDYVAARDEDLERRRREHAKAQDRVAGAKGTVMQFRHQKRFDGQYASRMKALERYQAALDRTPDPVLEKLGFGLTFDAVAKSSHEMLRAAGLTKAYGKQEILTGAELEVRKGDRIGLVGANGAGKSTLLKLLTGQETKDAGDLHASPGVKGLLVDQEHTGLDLERTLREEVLDARPTLEDPDVKALVGRFRFDPALDLPRKVSTLSGGERQRLMLLKAVLKPSNLLILDEPTNHLDLWAKDVVIGALNAYPGTLLIVSHDRHLLDAVTDTTVVLDDGLLYTYQGTFTETRGLHAKKEAAKTSHTYLVAKKFTDWTTGTRYRREEEHELTDAAVAASVTLRNALAQGWLVRKED
ncbi:MAG: ribosomal protection-like ABC-F family protein [Thermoplasmatota archaeon]